MSTPITKSAQREFEDVTLVVVLRADHEVVRRPGPTTVVFLGTDDPEAAGWRFEQLPGGNLVITAPELAGSSSTPGHVHNSITGGNIHGAVFQGGDFRNTTFDGNTVTGASPAPTATQRPKIVVVLPDGIPVPTHDAE